MTTTLRDISEIAGYSQGTISRVLAGQGGVKPSTRKRVLECARELGYEPRSRRKSRDSYTRDRSVRNVGLLIGAMCGLDLGSPDMGYIGHFVVQAMANAAAKQNLNLSISYVSAQADPQCVLESERWPPMLRSELDGLVLLYPFPEPFVREMAQQMPVVSWEQAYPETNVDVMGPNQTECAMLAVQELARAGHQRIAYLSGGCGNGNRFAVNKRLSGFICGMSASGLSFTHEDLLNCIDPREDFPMCEAVEARMDAGVTAVVCAVERDAYLMWKQLKQRGRRIPQALSIVSIGGVQPMYGLPALTTLRLPYECICEAILRRIVTKSKRPDLPRVSTEFDCELIPGQSVMPPPGLSCSTQQLANPTSESVS